MKNSNETVVKKPAVAKKSTVSKAPVALGTGRRKRAVARVFLRRGNGGMIINGLPYTEYFDTEISRLEATAPFRICEEALKFDIAANVQGGGKEAQADAVKLGFSRALVEIYQNLRPLLSQNKFLSVDSRVKERKKYGQKGARRKFQFVKR